MNMGYVYAVAAYLMWGLLPIYWKVFQGVGAGEILAHRIIWSVVFVLVLVAVARKWTLLRQAVPDVKSKLAVLMCSLLISMNWLLYIWAVNNNHIVEASLGYYINPLVNVFLGVLFLKERLSKLQWVSISLAAAGVLLMTLSYGDFPWVAITLALSFGLYGLTKKKVKVDTVVGLSLETLIVLPFALGYLLFVAKGGEAFSLLSGWEVTVLTLAGVATALPLLFFAEGVKRLPLSVMGFFQYLAPTISLFLGVWLYGEAFGLTDLISFGLIWSALVLYTFQIVRKQKAAKLTAQTARPAQAVQR